jgi:hypothetical protein
LTWRASQEPLASGQDLVLAFDGNGGHPGGGEVRGLLDGCPVDVTSMTDGIGIRVSPSAADGYRRLTIHNNSSAPISSVELQWKKRD